MQEKIVGNLIMPHHVTNFDASQPYVCSVYLYRLATMTGRSVYDYLTCQQGAYLTCQQGAYLACQQGQRAYLAC